MGWLSIAIHKEEDVALLTQNKVVEIPHYKGGLKEHNTKKSRLIEILGERKKGRWSSNTRNKITSH